MTPPAGPPDSGQRLRWRQVAPAGRREAAGPLRTSGAYIGLFMRVLQPAWTAAPFFPPPVMSVGVYSQLSCP